MRNKEETLKRATDFLRAHGHCKIAITAGGDVLIGNNDEFQ